MSNKFCTKIGKIKKKTLLLCIDLSPDGEMVDALVSGASALRRVGSSPILGTRSSLLDCSFFCAHNRTRTDWGDSAKS